MPYSVSLTTGTSRSNPDLRLMGSRNDTIPHRLHRTVRGYVTTTNPGPNQVNFELGLPAAWNERFLFIGNGVFAGSRDFLHPANSVPGTTRATTSSARIDINRARESMGALILAPICTQREFLTGGNTAAQITVSEEEVVALGLNVNRKSFGLLPNVI
jgi:hypothetical protein